jgi:hypothetical protein
MIILSGAEDGLGGWTTTELLDTTFLISTFGEDESGEIYVAHFSSPNGAIYLIVQDNSPPNASSSGGGGGCFIATAVHGSQEVMGVWARFVLKLFSPFRNLTI